MVEILKQNELVPMSVEKQVLIVFVANKGYLDDIAIEHVAKFEVEFQKFMEDEYPDVVREMATELTISDKVEQDIDSATQKFKEMFVAANAPASA